MWEEIYFFFAEGCYIWSVWANVREQKSLPRGIQPAGGFPCSAKEKEREALIQLAAQKQLYCHINCKYLPFGRYQDLRLKVMHRSQFELTSGFNSPQ